MVASVAKTDYHVQKRPAHVAFLHTLLMAARKKKAAPAEEGDVSPEQAERPELSEESAGALIELRGHLQKIPSGLRWPLEHLPSMAQHLSDLESAAEAVENLAIRHALSNEKFAELKRFLLNDAHAFGYLICRHHDIDPVVHMPLMYAAAGQANKLAWCLSQSGFEGYTIQQFRDACKVRSIDIATTQGIVQLDGALDWVNCRLPRGWYKSSTITHVGATITATVDPNTTAKITCAIDDKAWELSKQVRDTSISGIFRDFFPERVPAKMSDATTKKVTFGGRTVSSREETIQAGGYSSMNETGGHFDRHWIDDLTVGGKKGNANPNGQRDVTSWYSTLPNTFIISRRTRVVQAGTRWPYDDYEWLTAKSRAIDCFSILVPIEIHDGEVVNVTKRGTPTEPTFFPVEKIQALQNRMLSDETELEGVEAWRCNALLNPSAAGGRIFPDDVINDLDRSWMGPYDHPSAKVRKLEPHRFLVASILRNEKGEPLDRETRKPLDVSRDDWRARTFVSTFDPWSDLAIIITLNTTWSDGAQRWAATVAGIDPQLVAYHLETRRGENGSDEWATELAAMDKLYKPRLIGMDKSAHSDAVVQNMMRLDKRITGIRARIVPVSQPDVTHASRTRAALAEPLKMYRWMMLPTSEDVEHDYGASAVRTELTAYREGADRLWPIIDSMCMVSVLVRPVQSREQREKQKRAQRLSTFRYNASVNPALGVPTIA